MPTARPTIASASFSLRANIGQLWDGLLAPLNIAAYAIFGLIAINQLGAADAALRPLRALTLGLFIGAFLAAEIFCSGDSRPRLRLALLVLQVVAAMANLALYFDGINIILLVLVGAQLSGVTSLPVGLAVMAALDALTYLLLREVHTQQRPLFYVAVHATFQAFAMLTTWFAVRADLANRLLAAVNADLLATRSLLEEGARDGERLRLSRELHDVAGHTLTALQLNLELARRLPDEAQRQVRVEAAQGLAESLLRDIRGVVSQLRRHDGIDLPSALHALCRGFPGVSVQLDMDADLRVADVERAQTLLRAAQEALTNAVRHGRARHVVVCLQHDGRRVWLQVDDDGTGIVPLREGNGLRGMRERLARHGGELELQARPGQGLTLRAWLDDAQGSA